ncbi:MFS transporter [[Mycoplasma] mobile]|uniref:Unspecified permease n=1 Tax=Mycoplasma mobile (strain ATCC 43663 / 163K / NCTC 11711) TaxID=267748 RepID=Q6KI86_MYCM1|nr:MFS transporter [[Mycoplasma] mobile]AAT27690.1 unspecified permease [Mycoplasma mobile 163K]
MFSKLKKIANKIGKKGLVALIILAAVDVFVIAAPYYLRNIFPNLNVSMHVTTNDIAIFTAIIGWVTLITQLPGGWLADKISSKKLTALASLTTGLLTIWWAILILTGRPEISGIENQVETVIKAQQSILWQYYIIYVGWGISSTLIFWTPLWKLVSQQAKKEDQGLAYGIQGASNGIIGLFLVFLAGLLATFLGTSVVQGGIGFEPAFAIFVFLIAGYLIALSVMVLFWVPEYTTKEKFAIDFKIFFAVMKNPRIWLNSFFVMGMYMFQSVFAFYLLQFIRTLGADAGVTSAIPTLAIILIVIGGLRTYAFRFLVSAPVGHYADKAKSYIYILVIALGLGFIVTGVFLLVPGFVPFNELSLTLRIVIIAILIVLFSIAGILSWVMVTLRYATIGELPIPKKSYASTTALISFVAFSPDAWFYTIAGGIGSRFEVEGRLNQEGLTIILGFAIGVAIFGWLCGVILFIWNKIELKKLGKTNYRWRELQNT